MKVEGKTAIVVGGVRGIGKSYCEALLDKGAKVVIGDILNDVGEATAKEFNDKYGDKRVMYVKCDVTSPQDIKGLFQQAQAHYGPIEICIYNTGMINEHQWELMLDVNLIGCIRTLQEAVSTMSMETGGPGGLFIATASQMAMAGFCYNPVYTASKHGMLGLIRSWGNPEVLAKTGMRFNCVCPNGTRTDLFTDLASRFIHQETLPDMTTPEFLNSLHKPSFIAEGMMKLVEDDSVNGQALRCSKKYGHDYAELPNFNFQ